MQIEAIGPQKATALAASAPHNQSAGAGIGHL
jgi:hypothetical protein